MRVGRSEVQAGQQVAGWARPAGPVGLGLAERSNGGPRKGRVRRP